ncbi:MAG: tripartite tricarboxylate transporter substrate binding protein [Pseudomonadota bacterium]
MLAQAQGAYPQRPITIVVGYPPGGSTDLVARTVGQELAAQLGQPVVIDNTGGAGGSIGAQKVAHAQPDGYTLLIGANNEIAINALVKKSVRYSIGDFTPLGLVASQPLLLAAAATGKVKTVDDLIRAAKAQPGAQSYGSSGVGTSLHVAGEMIKQQAGISMVHVPYRGTGAITTDLIGGNLDYGVYVLSSALPQLQSGKLVALGITEAKRSPAAPNIPALAETPALKNVDIGVWFMLMGPARLPEPVVARLKAALAQVMKSPDFRQKMAASGSVVPETQPDLPRFLASETAKYQKIVQFANIKDE